MPVSYESFDIQAAAFGFSATEMGVPMTDAPVGFELRLRDNDRFSLLDAKKLPVARTATVRVFTDADGAVRLDRLEVDSLLGSIRLRRDLGYLLEITILGGSFDQVWAHHESRDLRWSVWSPMSGTLVGVHVSAIQGGLVVDMPFSGGSGVGTEVETRLAGPWFLHTRAEVETRFRTPDMGAGDLDVWRAEVGGEAEAGLSLRDGRRTWLLTAWGEARGSWWLEPDRPPSLPRHYTAAGVRVGVRLHE